nr:TRAM domain-containing protein [Leucobacter soli]
MPETPANPQPRALQPGDLIELEVTGIAHGGVCVARHDGRVVFVADAIPGERVRARVTEARKKSFARAATVEVLEPSEDRRPHVWAEVALDRDPEDRAGGAEFGHIALPRQRALKAEVLADALRRFGGLTDDEIARAAGGGLTLEAAPGDDESNGLGWRTRVRLHVDPETGEVGPYAARSRRVIPVESLPLAVEAVGYLAPLDELMPDVDTVDLVAPSADDPRMLIGFASEKPGRAGRARAGENDRVGESVGGREFLVRAGGFWQVHREAPRVLFEAVRDAILQLDEARRIDPAAGNLDLYGGAGLLAAAMAEAVGPTLKVTSVEADPGATDDAAENLAELVGALAVTARTDRHLADLLRSSAPVRERLRRATVVLDPPRSGAGGEVCAQLGELAPANLVYVACDPVALARDTGTLRGLGYELVSLRAFDLFPHTHHFEALAVFTRV